MNSVKLYFRSLILLLLIAIIYQPAAARVEDGTVVDPAVIRPLMKWVEQRTGQTVPVLPRVVASRIEFQKILASMGSEFEGRPQALYIPGTIYVDHLRWDPEDYVQLSLVIHEMVHHAQLFMTDRKWPCPDARETQAYQLQNQWLSENNHYPFVQAAWIERVSACPAQDHPLQLAQQPN